MQITPSRSKTTSRCLDILSVSYTSCCTPHYVSDGCSLVSFKMFCFQCFVKSTHREAFAQSGFKDRVTLMMPCGFKDLRCKGVFFVSILQCECLSKKFDDWVLFKMFHNKSEFYSHNQKLCNIIWKFAFTWKYNGTELDNKNLLTYRQKAIQVEHTMRINQDLM